MDISGAKVSDMSQARNPAELKRAADPNELNFEKMISDYVDDYNIKIPFVKSTFIHGAVCPM